MLRLKHNLFLLLSLLLPTLSNAQLKVEEDEYSNEFSIGLNTNSDGGLISGFDFKYLHKRATKKWDVYSLEVVNVRDKKEVKLSSATSSSFFPGKTNYLFSIRPSYGKEVNLFQRYPEDGIRVNFTYSGGPTIGLFKPYYIEYEFTNNGINYDKDVAYDPSLHSIDRIQGDSGLLYGLGNSKIKLGAHLRTALNFEYGPVPDMIIGIETGTTLEAFGSEIVLNQTNQNKQIYSAFFVQLYYGYRF